MDKLNALYDARAKHVADANALLARSKADGGKWSAEDETKFNSLHDAADGCLSEINALKATAAAGEAREKRQATADASLRESRGRRSAPADPSAGTTRAATMPAFRGQQIRLPAGSHAALRADAAYAEAFRAYLGGASEREVSATLQTDIQESGGFLAPPQYVAELIAELDSTLWIRRLARVLPPTTAPAVTMPRRTSRASTFAWGTELSEPTADTSYKLGTYTLTPHPMTGEMIVSKDLMAAASINPETIVRAEMLHNAGELEENAFLFGDGVRKPVGLFVPHVDGVPAARDVSGAVNTTDTFLDAKYSLREPHLRSDSLRWLFNRLAVRDLAKLKSTTGEPLWIVSTRDGEPERFLNVPVVLSEYAPKGSGTNNAWQTGDYFGLIGNFGFYDILDSLDMGLTRHTDSAYDRKNQVGFIARRKVDGCPRHAEAFARVKKS